MTHARRQSQAAMTGDILNDLFHACSLAAYLQQAQIQQGWPDSETTRRRAFAYFEEALKTKNRRALGLWSRTIRADRGGTAQLLVTTKRGRPQMNEIDLADFGFAGKKFLCEGDLDGEKKDGDKLLFLFAETDKGSASIGPNARNCVRLADDGVVGFVGVEYNPADQNDPGKDRRRADLNFDVEMIIHGDMARLKEARFGTTVRRLSNLPVDVVEDMGLWERAAVIESNIKEELIGEKQRELVKKLKAEKPREKYVKLDQEARREAELDPDVTKQFRDTFGDHPINYERDEAMVANLMARWAAVGTQKAAVLNAGKKHIDRIKDMLPPDVRYICVCHPAEEDRIRQVLMDYRSGKISKYGAMAALDLDHVSELLDLSAQYGIGPELTRDYFQSDPSAKPVKDFFTEGGER